MSDEIASLRKKKHLQTRGAIEQAAIKLVEDRGLANATIDTISQNAEVSKRTFFNYYDTKEDAILGFSKTDLLKHSDVESMSMRGGEDVIEFVIRVLVETFEGSIASGDLRRRRSAIMRTCPQLLERQMEIISKLGANLSTGLHTSLNVHFLSKQPIKKELSDVIMMLCFGAVRAATKEWLAADKRKSYKNIYPRATMLAREAIKIIHE
ncbi:MAG: TetR/AcrR family transcriptional regulator [Candidatus Saccharimonadales bacterium]